MASDSYYTGELEVQIGIFQELIENLVPDPGLYTPMLYSKEKPIEFEGGDHKT